MSLKCYIFKRSVLQSFNWILVVASFINSFISNIPLSGIINNASIVITSRPLYRFLCSPKGHTLYRVCFRLFFCATAPSGSGPSHSRGFYITHNDAPQSVGLLWTSDQLVAETCTWQHKAYTKQTNVHAPGRIRTHNPSRPATADVRLRPRSHWDRHTL